LRRAEREAGLRHAGAAGTLHGERDPEIGHQRLAIVEQDVLGLDVAMDNALGMGVVQRAGHLAADPYRLGDRQLALALEAVATAKGGSEAIDRSAHRCNSG
jgi:hypothetical protein